MLQKMYIGVIFEFVQDVWQRMDESRGTKGDRFGEEGVRGDKRPRDVWKTLWMGMERRSDRAVRPSPAARVCEALDVADTRTIHGDINPL